MIKLRQVEVLQSQGMVVSDAIRQISVSVVTYYRWRKEYRGMAIHQLKRLKEVEKENQRLRKAVSDLTLDKLILKEGISGKYWAPHVVVWQWCMSDKPLLWVNVELVVWSVNIVPLNVKGHREKWMKSF